MSNKLVVSALGAIISIGLNSQAIATENTLDKLQLALTSDMEKCYGVCKAGKNDCGTATDACSAQAKYDRQADAWIFVPKGTCDKIVGGSTELPKS